MAGVFNLTKRLVVQLGGARAALPTAVRQQASKVLMVTDAGIVKLGLMNGALDGLAKAGAEVHVFSDVCEDPTEDVVERATAHARAVGAEAVVGFGGGSSMDVAKLVALLAAPDAAGDAALGSLDAIYGVGQVEANAPRARRLPLFQVPTTAGTGSEVTPISIITTRSAEKKGVVDPILLPDAAVLDGELTVTVPQHVTSATGIDAMVHAIEAYTSKVRKNPLSDSLAHAALRLLGANIKAVTLTEPDNLQARSDMLLGSCFAGIAFANSPVAAVHALAYPIGSIHHVPHGLSNALMLAHVMRANLTVDSCSQQYSEIARLCLPGATFSSNPATAAKELAEGMAALCEELKMKTRLREVGIEREGVPLLASEAMKQTRLLVNNPREVDLALAEELYTAAW